MAFFRNWRSSLPRGRDLPHDRISTSGTKVGNKQMINESKGSPISQIDVVPNRSETFILGEEGEGRSPSNISAMEMKKLKKSKLPVKFNTFTKRKKAPPASAPDTHTSEDAPTDNVDNTYEKWSTDGLEQEITAASYELPFEEKSSEISLAYGNGSVKGTVSSATCHIDSSTYQKNTMSNALRQQFEQLKKMSTFVGKIDNFPEDVLKKGTDRTNKYKTVTVNNFRKSFRERFLQQDKRAPYNPSWFVEVEPAEKTTEMPKDSQFKKKRHDLIVFDNDNYKPEAHAPVQDADGRTILASQSSVKRYNTFKVQRPHSSQAKKSIPEMFKDTLHVEFKNSITPNRLGRVIPVGVANPITSAYINDSGKKPTVTKRKTIFTASQHDDLPVGNYRAAADNPRINRVAVCGNTGIRSVPTAESIRRRPSQTSVTVPGNNQRIELHPCSKYISPSSTTTCKNRFTVTTNTSRLPKKTHSSGVVTSSQTPRNPQRKYGVTTSSQQPYDSYNGHVIPNRTRSHESSTPANNRRNQAATGKPMSSVTQSRSCRNNSITGNISNVKYSHAISSARRRSDSPTKIAWR
ncbi:uncharacterized protein LOC119632658 [Glossina fuscipes]|uniref:Uncharacterized protein LOC119632658 n=1 Tax=Glossina fuscipes TaxID=7396 RepID=A0A8U0W8Q7_9MUSC|nr:uncharacterized protein LOC119632658 [Glossina fuscipes]KAI9587987.1 hypothetical protein GQX74_003833 [Glossina fuscipes]